MLSVFAECVVKKVNAQYAFEGNSKRYNSQHGSQTTQRSRYRTSPCDEQIRAELDAIAYVNRDLIRRHELALEREAEQWVVEHSTEWRQLCREIVLAAVRLAALEERARDTLKPIDGCWVRGLAMGATIGSGLSLLGIGDPLSDMRTAALAEGIITASDLKKAEKNDF